MFFTLPPHTNFYHNDSSPHLCFHGSRKPITFYTLKYPRFFIKQFWFLKVTLERIKKKYIFNESCLQKSGFLDNSNDNWKTKNHGYINEGTSIIKEEILFKKLFLTTEDAVIPLPSFSAFLSRKMKYLRMTESKRNNIGTALPQFVNFIASSQKI